MRSEFENSIKWSSSYEKLVYQHGERLFIFDDGKYKIAAVQLAWELFKEQQSKVDELQKRMEILEAILESERWDREAGFKVFFKARDMRGGWHGFAKKPEYYENGGYWTNGGKSIYLQGDEWCDRETALNSLVTVKQQALKGGEANG